MDIFPNFSSMAAVTLSTTDGETFEIFKSSTYQKMLHCFTSIVILFAAQRLYVEGSWEKLVQQQKSWSYLLPYIGVPSSSFHFHILRIFGSIAPYSLRKCQELSAPACTTTGDINSVQSDVISSDKNVSISNESSQKVAATKTTSRGRRRRRSQHEGHSTILITDWLRSIFLGVSSISPQLREE